MVLELTLGHAEHVAGNEDILTTSKANIVVVSITRIQSSGLSLSGTIFGSDFVVRNYVRVDSLTLDGNSGKSFHELFSTDVVIS